MGSDPALIGTFADAWVQEAQGIRPARPVCAAMLGKHGDVTVKGFQFEDRNGRARCAFFKPCPEHDKEAPDA